MNALDIVMQGMTGPVWFPNLAGLISAFGCTVDLSAEEDLWHPRTDRLGDSPSPLQLCPGGVILSACGPLNSPDKWAWAAHEAAHWSAGEWSLEDELPMLPWELELLSRVADKRQVEAAVLYMLGTALGDIGLDLVFVDIDELVTHYGLGWQLSEEWLGLRAAGEEQGLSRWMDPEGLRTQNPS